MALIGPISFLATGGVPGACDKVGRRKAVYELPEEVERGGGWGPPRERDGHRIAADLADGYITAEGARRDYGYGGGSDAL